MLPSSNVSNELDRRVQRIGQTCPIVIIKVSNYSNDGRLLLV